MSQSTRRVALVIVMVVMVAAAVPMNAVSASILDSHSTNSEFEAGTLNGVSTTNDKVRGGLINDFEDGDTTSQNDYWNAYSGDTGNLSVTSKLDGNALQLSTSGSYNIVTSSTTTALYPREIEFDIQIESQYSGAQQERVQYSNSQSDFFYIQFDHDANEIKINMDGAADSTATIKSGWSGGTRYNFRLDIDHQNENIDIYINGNLELSYNADGANFFQNGIEEVNLHEDGDGNSNNLWFDNHHFHNLPSDNVYISDSYSASDLSNGYTDLSLTNSNATVTWEGYDGNTWNTVDQTTYTTSGNKTADLSLNSYTQFRVKVSFGATGASPDGTLSEEGITHDDAPPQLDNSSASPQNDPKLSSSSVTLEIDVSDADFPTTQGDSVDVKFQLKSPSSNSFSTDSTVTVSSNGTASTTAFAGEGGQWEWRAVATDDYGNTVTSQTFQFTTPSELELRNETNTSQLVTTATPVEVTFFGDQNTVTETTTNGIVNLSSQNVSDPFIVNVEETDDYYSRTIYIQDIYTQQTVYLLSKNKTSVESRFTLDDPTGEFTSQSFLIIQKPVNSSGTTSYKTIVADRFGVEGVTATLEKGQRYRIRVRSPDGKVQDIGPYRAATSETVTVQPGAPAVSLDNTSDDWSTGVNLSGQTLKVRYSDPENLTDSLTIWVHERGNTSNTLAPNKTFSDVGDVSVSYSLTANESAKEWVVNYQIDRDGEKLNKSVYAVDQADTTPSGLDSGLIQLFGVAAVLMTAGVFSMADSHLGILVVPAMAGLLWWAGWLAGVTSLAALILALFVGVLGYTSGEVR